MASIYIQNWMTLIIQIWMNVTVVNIIQNWMTLIIQCLLVVTHVQYIALGTLQPRALGVLNHVDPFDFMSS